MKYFPWPKEMQGIWPKDASAKKKSSEGKVDVRNLAKISCENAKRNPERENGAAAEEISDRTQVWGQGQHRPSMQKFQLSYKINGDVRQK